jgi:hypothetical protein
MSLIRGISLANGSLTITTSKGTTYSKTFAQIKAFVQSQPGATLALKIAAAKLAIGPVVKAALAEFIDAGNITVDFDPADGSPKSLKIGV